MGSISNHIKLTQRVIVKSPGLLPMQYKLGEIAQKLEIHPRTLVDWTNAGAPHTHDARGHIWIVGTEFAKWVEEVRNQKKHHSREKKMADNQAYCMRCRKPVDLNNPVTTPGRGKQFFIKSVCPICGCAINRGGRRNG